MKKQVYGDAEYVKKRDALIPKAEQFCDKALGVVNVKSRGQEWTKLFMRTMDRLWKVQYLGERSRIMADELARLNTEQLHYEGPELVDLMKGMKDRLTQSAPRVLRYFGKIAAGEAPRRVKRDCGVGEE